MSINLKQEHMSKVTLLQHLSAVQSVTCALTF